MLLNIVLSLCLIFLGLYTLIIRKKLSNQLEVAKSELKHAHGINNARNLFLAGLSHELRTPLSGIIGAAQLFNQTSLNTQQQEYVRMINSASTVLLEIIDDMLTFSRINTGQIKLIETSFDIRKDIDDLLLIQAVRLQNRSIALVIDIDDNVPQALWGDRGKLNQILLNIVGNAIKYTQEGSITIEVNSKPIDQDKTCIGITISDTGMGMTPEALENVFQPFSQSNKQYLDNIANSGMGLGLAICKRLVMAMGGEINIQSEVEHGTTVYLQFCFEKRNEESIDKSEQLISSYQESNLNYEEGNNDKAYMANNALKSMVVLVVEDDEINRLVCTRYLATYGHHPIVVANHVQAKEILSSGAYIPDVILMDINLEGMSGVQLAAVLRKQADYLWQHIPIIFMSADVSGQAENNCQGIENSCFIEKPFSANKLNDALHKIVKPINDENLVDDNHIEQAQNHSEINGYLSNYSTEKLYKSAKLQVSINQIDIQNKQKYDLLNLEFIRQEIQDLGSETVLEMLNIFRSNSVSIAQNMSKAVDVGDYSVAASLAHKLKGSAANLGLIKVSSYAQEICDYLQQPDFVSRDQAKQMVVEVGMLCHPSSDQVRSLLLRP